MDDKQARRIEKLLGRVTVSLGATYENIAFLDEGGMSAVFTGRHRRLKRIDAIKVLFVEGPGSVDALDRFRGEWETIAALGRSPHIVSIYEANHDEADDLAWLTEEFVDGPSLKKKMEAGRMPLNDGLAIATQISQGLVYAHDRGVIHRDIKPGNILVEKTGDVVITDFGLARFQGDDRLTQTHMAVGTLAFMSPEALRGEDPAPAMDVYSLGIVFYEMFTGERLFAGANVIQRQLTEEAPDPQAAAPDLPRKLCDLILAMLKKDSAERPDARSVSETLGHISQTPAQMADATMTVDKRPKKPGTRNILGAVPWGRIVLVAGVILALGAGWWAMGLRDNGDPGLPMTAVTDPSLGTGDSAGTGDPDSALGLFPPPGDADSTEISGTPSAIPVGDSLAALDSGVTASGDPSASDLATSNPPVTDLPVTDPPASDPPASDLPIADASAADPSAADPSAADETSKQVGDDASSGQGTNNAAQPPALSSEIAVRVGVSGPFRREAQSFRILIDDRDTGLTGPRIVNLPRPTNQRVTVSLRQLGFMFVPEETTLVVADRSDTVQVVFRAARP